MAASMEKSTQEEGAKLIASSRPTGSAGAQWMIDKAKNKRKDDVFAAKSLLLTAKALYPSNFLVQFEAYLLEKAEQNKKEASSIIMHIFHQFQNEAELQAELCDMTAALQFNAPNEKKFLKGVFELLPDSVQKEILIFCASKSSDQHNKYQLQLLLMKKFPDLVHQHGVALVNSLLELDKQECNKQPLNTYRQLLVTEVLPVILTCENLDISSKQRTKWLHLAMEFYINVAMTSRNNTDLHKSVLMSPLKLKSPEHRLDSKDMFMKGDVHLDVGNPWERVHHILALISQRNSWDTNCLLSLSMDYQHSFTYLANMLHQHNSAENPNIAKPIFFSMVLLFFQAAHSFTHKLNPELLGDTSTTVSHCGHIILEDLDSKKRARKHKHKKKKMEGEILADHDSTEDASQISHPTVHIPPSSGFGEEVTHSFVTAVNCWHTLMIDPTFGADFAWILSRWKCDEWVWLRMFKIEQNLYKGDYSPALQLIQEEVKLLSGDQPPDQTTLKRNKLQLYLQQASCQFNLGQYTLAAESVLEAVPLIEEIRNQGVSIKITKEKLQPSKHLRVMNVLPCKAEHMLPYCIQLIFIAFKKKVLHYADASDTALGHMISMMQYDWPKEENTFFEILKRLKKVGNFSYPVFFNYIINIDILEEFAYIRTEDGGKVKLEFFPPCITIQRQQRTITRGVTRGGKEDFRSSIEKQVSRCEENISELLLKFLAFEKDSLLQCLNAHSVQC